MSNSSYYIKSLFKNDSVFDVDISNNIFSLCSRHNGSNQRFIPNNLGENIYIFSVEYNNSLVMTAQSNLSEEKLKLMYRDPTVDDKWQQFKLIDNYDGSFKIQNVGSNLYLEVNNTLNYCFIHLNKFRNDRQQLFYFEKADKS